MLHVGSSLFCYVQGICLPPLAELFAGVIYCGNATAKGGKYSRHYSPCLCLLLAAGTFSFFWHFRHQVLSCVLILTASSTFWCTDTAGIMDLSCALVIPESWSFTLLWPFRLYVAYGEVVLCLRYCYLPCRAGVALVGLAWWQLSVRLAFWAGGGVHAVCGSGCEPWGV